MTWIAVWKKGIIPFLRITAVLMHAHMCGYQVLYTSIRADKVRFKIMLVKKLLILGDSGTYFHVNDIQCN